MPGGCIVCMIAQRQNCTEKPIEPVKSAEKDCSIFSLGMLTGPVAIRRTGIKSDARAK